MLISYKICVFYSLRILHWLHRIIFFIALQCNTSSHSLLFFRILYSFSIHILYILYCIVYSILQVYCLLSQFWFLLYCIRIRELFCYYFTYHTPQSSIYYSEIPSFLLLYPQIMHYCISTIVLIIVLMLQLDFCAIDAHEIHEIIAVYWFYF